MKGLHKLAWMDLAIVAVWFYEGAAASATIGFLHLGVTLAAARLAWRGGEGWSPWSWSGLALPLGIVLGAPGILVLLGLRPFGRRLSHRMTRTTKIHSGERRRVRNDQDEVARLLDGRVCIPGADDVEALCAILRHGTLERRCAALQAVVRSFEPALTPLVAIALADADQTVRALAAATSAQISANLAERIAHIEAEPVLDLEERYDFAMLLFEHGCRNVLLSRSQAAHLRSSARLRLAAVLNDQMLPSKMRAAAEVAMGKLATPRANHADSCMMQLAHGAAAA